MKECNSTNITLSRTENKPYAINFFFLYGVLKVENGGPCSTGSTLVG